MAIPKEPRQLMINIMYLVLTALLALNVSAEIFNAFKMVDHGLVESNKSLDQANAALVPAIKDGAKKKNEFQIYADRIEPVRATSKGLCDYIDNIVNTLIDQSGDNNGEVGEGDYVVKGSKRNLKGKKNKDVTTRMLINDGVGEELKAKILEAKATFATFIDTADQASEASKLPLKIDDESWRLSKDKKTWAEFNFKQMPLQACIPIFTKIKNDAKATEAGILNYFNGKVGGKDVVLDKFQVFSSPKKAYVIKGERYETTISLGASASAESNTGVSIAVNGANLKVDNEGSAAWSATANAVGVRKYTATVSIKNPVTDEVQTFKREFEYEVGERSCNVAAEKMNVFYIGVDNPVSVTAAGISSNQLKVSATGSGINLTGGKGKFNAKVTKPGEATISVSGGGLQATNFTFRVKRIPDPVARLGNVKDKSVPSGIFKAQQGCVAHLDNFDFEARCNIMGFQVVRIAKRQDPEIALNRGGRFGGDAAGIISKAKPGDRYFFENVKAKCPGDSAGRNINDIVFTIK